MLLLDHHVEYTYLFAFLSGDRTHDVERREARWDSGRQNSRAQSWNTNWTIKESTTR